MTVEQWTSVLDLAHRWGFGQVKALVIRELQKLTMPDIERIAVYHRYDADRGLLLPCYKAVCERKQTLSLDEGLRLGTETVINIALIREYARSVLSADGSRTPAPVNISADELYRMVKEIFGVHSSSWSAADADGTVNSSSGGSVITSPS